jgi:hypothetical protein
MNSGLEQLQKSSPTNPAIDLRSRRRWLQFSIRGLLVFITLVALFLVFVVLPAERQRRACNLLETSGGFWMFSQDYKIYKSSQQDTRSQFHKWIRHYLDKIEYAFVCRTELENLQLDSLPHLKYLHLYGVTLSSTSLPEVGKLPQLEKLELEACEIHGKDLSGMGDLKRLKEIKSISTEFRCDSLSGIEKLQSLEVLDLYFPGFSRYDLTPIAKLPRLKSLGRSGLDFTSDGYKQLSNSSSLETIYVPAAQFKPENVAQLFKIKTLKSIFVTETNKTRIFGSNRLTTLLDEIQKMYPSITIQDADARK